MTNGNYNNAYIYSALLIVCWFLYQLTNHSGFVVTYQLASKLKSALAMLLYAKISKLTSYVMKNSQMGKITNLLANDLGIIELRINDLIFSSTFPVLLLGMTILLITRIGWPAIVGILIMILLIPLSNMISRRNGRIIEEINIHKDKRVQLTTQTIEGIKYVKLYGWELAFKKIIEKVREKQIEGLRKVALGRSVDRSLAYVVGFVSTFVMYVLAYEVNNALTFTIIFSTLEIMASLKQRLTSWILGIGLYYELKIVFGRFASIFNIENTCMIEIDEESKKPILNLFRKSSLTEENGNGNQSDHFMTDPIKKIQSKMMSEEPSPVKRGAVHFKNFNGYWKSDFSTPALKNISYSFEPGHIYGITGRVGSGKSGLIGAILKEIPYFSGKIQTSGIITYVEQQPIVFSDTIKNNIIFGRPYSEERYKTAITISCLQSDFEILPEGEMTIVGEKGTTLSGGQKARLALTRAVYEEADVYLFDDPLSAVDSRVAKLLFEKCLRPLGKEKTVILVTHQIGYIQQCDFTLIMDDGAIVHSGKPHQLKQQLEQLSHILNEVQPQQQTIQEEGQGQFQMSDIRMSNLRYTQLRHSKRNTVINSNSNIRVSGPELKDFKPEDVLKNRFDEKDAQVTLDTYRKFFMASPINCCLVPFTIVLFFVSQAIVTVYYRFLADFDQVLAGTSSVFSNNFTIYWSVLSGIIVVFFFVLVIKFYCLNLSLINASQTVHENI